MLDPLSLKVLADLRGYFTGADPKFVRSDGLAKRLNIPHNQVSACLMMLHEKGYIVLTDLRDPMVIVTGLTHAGFHYDEEEFSTPTIASPVFNIGTVNNSAIGNSGSVTINNDLSFDAFKALILQADISSEDKEQLLEASDCLESVIVSDEPLEKGMLSKFGDAIVKHGPLFLEAVKLVLPYLINTPTPPM